MSIVFLFFLFTYVNNKVIILLNIKRWCVFLDKSNDYVISEKIRIELANFVKQKREETNLGLNQISIKADVASSIWSRLENAKLSKINPFLLQKVGRALNIDYKELYKIVGFLDKNEIIKDSFIVQQNSHTGDIKVNVNYYLLSCNCSICNKFAKLSNYQKEKVLYFIEKIEKRELKNKRGGLYAK